MKYRVAAIAVVDHALNTLTDDCIRGIAQAHKKNKTVALTAPELKRVKAKVAEVISKARAAYPPAPGRSATNRRRY
jgi:hypothetical protein